MKTQQRFVFLNIFLQNGGRKYAEFTLTVKTDDMVKKDVLIIGGFLFFITFLFPPCYDAFDALAGDMNMKFQPLWSLQGSAYAINTTVWFTILGSIAFGTFLFTKIAEKNTGEQAVDEANESQCSDCGADVSEDHQFCPQCGMAL